MTETDVNCIKCKKKVFPTQNKVCCSDCDGWLHLKCSGLTLKALKTLTKDKLTFQCKYCKNYKCGKCEKPVYDGQNAIQCDVDECQTWFHLKCTRFTLSEYVNKKSRLHTDHWYCSNCTCFPFDNLSQGEFMKLQTDYTKLKEYFSFITSNTQYSKTCSVCTKQVKNVKHAFPCTSCNTYIHRKCTGVPLSQILQGKPKQFKYWNCKTCMSNHFPFADLDDGEVHKLSFNSNVSCSCAKHTENTPLDKCETFQLVERYLPKDTPFDIGPDPNIDLTYDINAKCNYYSTHDFHRLTKNYKDRDKKPFTAIHTNIESLSHNFDSLEQLCINLDYPFDVVAVSETWNSEKSKDGFIPKVLPGYEPYIGLTGTTLKSGCGLYIRSGLAYIQRKDLDMQFYDDLNEFQMKFIEIVMPKSTNIILSVTYRHPKKTSNQTFIEKLKEILDKISNEHKIVISLGDFNYNLLNHDKDTYTKDFTETMYSYSLQPTINKPTRVVKGQRPSLLDNIFTNAVDKDIDTGNLTDKISDHMPNFIVMKDIVFEHKKIDKKVRSFKNFDLESYQRDINSIDLLPILHCNDVNEICKYYHDQVMLVINRHAPFITLTNNQLKWRKKPWIDKNIQKLISLKNRLYRKFLAKKSDSFWFNRYKNVKKHVEKLLFVAKKVKSIVI